MHELIGSLLICLSPHTSAGVLGRLIGFTSAKAQYGHPFFHAAKRRNCDGDEDSIMLLLDGLLNFSDSFVPTTRGGTMDIPRVLSTRIDPMEIDSEAHNVELNSEYPLEFYEHSEKSSNPTEVLEYLDIVSKRLESPEQYEGYSFSHSSSSINLCQIDDFCLTQSLSNYKKAKQIYLDLYTNHNDPRAAYALAEYYDDHWYFSSNYKKAFKHYLFAAENGVPEAQFNVANMYEFGDGIKKDLVQSVRWYLQCNYTSLCGAGYELSLIHI